MDDPIRELIFQTIDQTISDADFERLQDAIQHDQDARAEYLKAVGLCETLSEIAIDASSSQTTSTDPATTLSRGDTTSRRSVRPLTGTQLSIALLIMILVGGSAYSLGRINLPSPLNPSASRQRSAPKRTESRMSGHATLRRVVDVVWADDSMLWHEGDVLPHGSIAFERGVAEIDFFCGATLIVEGPAKLRIESDWSVSVSDGRLRAIVPPAARGFVVVAAGTEIVDLGTEFALEVKAENVQVEVIDGEVKFRGGEFDGQHLFTGECRSLAGNSADRNLSDGISTVLDIQQRRQAAEESRFQQWQKYSQRLRSDERLIAYYPIAGSEAGRSVPNASSQGSDYDGLVVGPVDRTRGRFGAFSDGLSFDRPGARVRTRIDGEFGAFSFVCWVRIDRLEHRYNSLFMGDGYENGEPHWQIRDDGKLMFSVMVDDTQLVQHYNEREQRVVADAGLHRVYFTDPIWDPSKSGRWLHLAAVYDPNDRRVIQFVDGAQVSSEEIGEEFHISTLKIGPAEIGNWGQPFRSSPWFAVRNLNGTIDELLIFDAALRADEIREIYEQGKPLGY